MTSVGLSLFNYKEDARSNKHKIHVIYLQCLPFQVTDVCCRWSTRLMPTMGHFSVRTIWNVHLMGHCCPIHPLTVNKFLSFHGSSRFTTKYTEASQRTLNPSSVSQIQPTFSQPTSLKAISISFNPREGQHSLVSIATRLWAGELDKQRLVRYDNLSLPNCPEWHWDPSTLSFNK